MRLRDQPELLNQAQASDFLTIKPYTLLKWRAQGRGPAYIKVGGSVRYDPRDLLAYIESRKVSQTQPSI